MSIQVHPKEHRLPDPGNYPMSNPRPKPEMHRSKCTLVESLPQEVVNKETSGRKSVQTPASADEVLRVIF